MMNSNNLEGESYDWFLLWLEKCDACSFYWKKCTVTLLKIFHDEEEEELYTKFVHLTQKGNVSDYTHEWEVLETRQTGFSDEKLLKLYISCLRE